MAVYVDNMRAVFGLMKMSHMIADTGEELRAMADAIGVARKWIQYKGTHREHFDVCATKRAKAIELGAIEVSMRELALMIKARRPQLKDPPENEIRNHIQ